MVNWRVCEATIMAAQFNRPITQLEYVAQLGYILIKVDWRQKWLQTHMCAPALNLR